MPGREQEQWLDRLGASGIRRDVLQQKSDETVLYECHNLDPFSIAGAIRKQSGQVTTPLLYAWYSHSGFYPPILTVGAHSINSTDYLHGVGHISPDIDNGLHFYYQESGSGALAAPFGQFECDTWELIAPPTYFMGTAITPRGDQKPVVISERVDVTVPSETDLSHDGPVHREAKTGYPFVGFIEGAAGSRNWYPPFSSYIGTNAAHETYMRSMGWGLVGTAYNATDGNIGGPITADPESGYFLEYDVLPSAGQPWKYGYANYGDENAVGWGEKFSGTNTSRFYLRRAAVGYAYVYADGTMSELFVMTWWNDWRGTAKSFVPVNMCVNPVAAGPASVDTNYCVIAWKFRCRLPKELLIEHSVVGVRVFYSHWSSREGDSDPYDWDLGYQGWTTEASVFANMREVMYLDDGDRKVGYCRIEEADMTVVTESGTSFEMVYFNEVMCPNEKSVAQINEVSSGLLNIVVENPMTLGRTWSEIKGEAYTETGVVANVGTDSEGVTIKIFENGSVVKEYSYTAGSAGDFVSPYAQYVTAEVPQTAAMSHGCVSQIGRLFHWGVSIPSPRGWAAGGITDRRTVWDTLYPTHIDQDGLSWPSLIRMDLGVPIRMGDIRGAVSIGRDILVATEAGVALVSFGSGLVAEWSVRGLDPDVGIAIPGALAVVGSECFIVATDGMLYRYRDGAAGLEPVLTGLRDDDSPILPRYLRTGETYPTSFVYDRVSIAAVPSEERIFVCYTYQWTGVATVVIDTRTMNAATGTRFFIAASRPSGGMPFVTNGNHVLRLFDSSADFYESTPATSYTTATTVSGQAVDALEIIDTTNVIDKDLYNLAGGSGAWVAKSKIMVGFSDELIATIVAGLPPGGTLFYRSNGWKEVSGYTADYSSLGTHGLITVATPLYDNGGKYTVTPDLWTLIKTVTPDTVTDKMPWKLSFEKFIVSPGRRMTMSMIMLKGTIQDTFTIKFYADGSATAHTTLTLTGGFSKYKQIRTRVPAKHSVKIVMEATAGQIDVDGVFDLQRVGFMFREGGRLGQGA